jgi:hypothetical protein
MGGLVLDIYVEYIIRAVFRFFRALRARSWPLVTARVTTTSTRAGGFGCAIGEITYLYRVDGEAYTGVDRKPFILNNSAENYVAEYSRGEELPVRVSNLDPAASVL